ncbi:MAG: hypothetical protein DCF17_00125 [Shackletoniella antarctica]|jgi:hypothetical protein|uniref:Uncharacterized protein n=1 Tax=Shackletoniella antarctica TaxID=268115 RepID=A0A2W4WKZ5_9CYAN|nr:MAG: hypothetical protein DCF17_00125 [Shackletoniella antarctica]
MNFDIIEPVLATLLGFLAAFFAEPVKTTFLHKRKVQNLRKALYKEISSLVDSIQIYMDASTNEAINMKNFSISSFLMSDFEAYQFAMSEPLLFYELPESQYINRIYKHIQLFKSIEENCANSKAKKELSEKYIELIIMAFEEGKFDRRLLKKIIPNRRQVRINK